MSLLLCIAMVKSVSRYNDSLLFYVSCNAFLDSLSMSHFIWHVQSIKLDYNRVTESWIYYNVLPNP